MSLIGRVKMKIASVLVLSVVISFLSFKLFESPSRKQEGGLTVEQYLQKVNEKGKAVLVYFKADWCVPCIKFKPVMDQIISEQKGSIEILVLDVDENPLVSQHLEINTLPLFIIYKNGTKMWEKNSAVTKTDLVNKIETYK
jgi:thioredoxin 1